MNLNFLQSQFVCLCLCILKIRYCVQVGWVSPRTGLPPFLPSSLQLAVLDTTCYKALPSASKLLDSRLLEVKLKNLSWSVPNMPPEYCCLFLVWALALQVCHVVVIYITTVLILFLPSCINPFSIRSAPCLAPPPTPCVHLRLLLVSLASLSTSPSAPRSAR